jgi:hypothetical protein
MSVETKRRMRNAADGYRRPGLCAVFLLLGAVAVFPQVKPGVFDPASDCEKLPLLFRDAARDADIDNKKLCYIADRARFAAKAGEAYARDLDRIGKWVRVVVPFGHLLLINGTEQAVRFAVRRYDAENEIRTNAAKLGPGERFLDGINGAADHAREAIEVLRSAYAKELRPYKNH